MKKTFLVLLSSISMLLVSCDNDILSDQEYNHFNSSAQSTTWQEQLEYAKNKNSAKTRASTNGIFIIQQL